VEIIESEFPTRVERFEVISDSGGAGRWRGGLGFLRQYRILTDEVRFSMRTDKHDIEPFGSDGGLPGRRGGCIINGGSKNEVRLPSRFGDHRLQKGDVVRLERPGGGGLGDPLQRPAEKVLDDVRQGYVSRARAESDYGVAIEERAGEPQIDRQKTLLLRGKN
jgi:N-methylhydantoinase B